MQDIFDLTGKVLIAMPGMSDARFGNSLILLCAHSGNGAMGLMVNKPTEHISSDELFAQLRIDEDPDAAPPGHLSVYAGGPVEMERGFVLHSPEYRSGLATLDVTEEVLMTATLDVLEDIAASRGPERAMIMLGYCGWGPGQLEQEIAEGGWIIGDAVTNLIFGGEDLRKWDRALKAQGLDPLSLSMVTGHA